MKQHPVALRYLVYVSMEIDDVGKTGVIGLSGKYDKLLDNYFKYILDLMSV